MSLIVAELEAIPGAKANAGRPSKVLRGPRRRQAKKALTSLQVIAGQDFNEMGRSDRYKYKPLYVMGEADSADAAAFERVMRRLQKVLDAVG